MASLAPRRGGGAQRAQAAPASAWATLFHDWEAVVGPSLARHVTPQRLDADVLVVSVDRPPWATQVRALGPQILARVAERIAAAPTRLEVVVRPR